MAPRGFKRPLQPLSTGHILAVWEHEVAEIGAVTDRLAQIANAGDWSIGPPTFIEIHDSYHDTPDWRIQRARRTFLVRSCDGMFEAYLRESSPVERGLSRRREIAQPAADAEPADLLDTVGPVSTRLSLICGHVPLRCVGEVSTRRVRYTLAAVGGAIGLIALDDSFLTGVDPETPERLARLAIQVPPQAIPSILPFVEALSRELNLVPARTTIFERAVQARGLRPGLALELGPMDTVPSATTGDVAYSVLRRHLVAFVEHEPGVRLGEDPDAVHDMRVATRRMRAALRLFRDALPPRLTIAMNNRLQMIARALGAVRDLELMLADTQTFRSALAVSETGALEPLIGILEGRLEEARRGLLRVLDSPKYARLLAVGAQQLQKGNDGRAPIAAAPIGLSGPVLVGRIRRGLRRALRRLRHSPSAEGLHVLRIRAKRMRYALEFLLPLYGKPSREMIRGLVRIQDALGAHQDAEVALDVLRTLIRTQGERIPHATSIAIGEMAQLYAARATDARRRFHRARQGIRGGSWRRLKREILDETQRCARRLIREGVHPVSGAVRKAGSECDSTSSDMPSQKNVTPNDGPTTDSVP